ncbi:MAG: radical SAM family heme chaperone HemW [Candidatus Gracilibacteria bacterium]|nr:radical SAM family heme chaperone HemW [Candidatus Gracilibacteria bacterium]
MHPLFSYLHIPFCRQKCLYCKFALTPEFDDLRVRTYIDALKREIMEFFRNLPDKGSAGGLQSIYFGGGTPSILSGGQIGEILDIFRQTRPVSSKETSLRETEITLEANPEDITREYVDTLSTLGVNRLSLGVQTLNSESLRAVGRAELNDSILRALDILEESPIANISVDLIAGLPHTRPGQMMEDLEEIFAHVSPKHVSIYMLEDEVYPESWRTALPTEEMIQNEYLSGVKWLEDHGFHRYELSNFALPGYESRHNRAYWDHSEYRGFGLSAASFIGGRRFANSSSFAGYFRGEVVDDGCLDEEALRIERMMFGLRTQGVHVSDIQRQDILQKFVSDGLLKIREKKILPTSTGIFLIDYIMGELL